MDANLFASTVGINKYSYMYLIFEGALLSKRYKGPQSTSIICRCATKQLKGNVTPSLVEYIFLALTSATDPITFLFQRCACAARIARANPKQLAHLLQRRGECDSPALERRPHEGDGRLAPPAADAGAGHQVTPTRKPLGAVVHALQYVVEQLRH
jgi:hypothetical protein